MGRSLPFQSVSIRPVDGGDAFAGHFCSVEDGETFKLRRDLVGKNLALRFPWPSKRGRCGPFSTGRRRKAATGGRCEHHCWREYNSHLRGKKTCGLKLVPAAARTRRVCQVVHFGISCGRLPAPVVARSLQDIFERKRPPGSRRECESCLISVTGKQVWTPPRRRGKLLHWRDGNLSRTPFG